MGTSAAARTDWGPIAAARRDLENTLGKLPLGKLSLGKYRTSLKMDATLPCNLDLCVLPSSLVRVREDILTILTSLLRKFPNYPEHNYVYNFPANRFIFKYLHRPILHYIQNNGRITGTLY